VSVTGIGVFGNVNAVQRSTSTEPVQGAARPQGAPAASSTESTEEVAAYIVAAAAALGMSTDEVVEALASGLTLADLADQQSVSRGDLVAALVADAPAELQASGEVEEMVAHLVDQVGLGGPGGGRPPRGSTGVLGESLTSDQQTTLDLLSGLLDTSSSDLVSALRGGTSLATLLSGAGVSYDALAGAVEAGLLIDTSA
jgi:lambda repressor-like predicted transcriptional regulator